MVFKLPGPLPSLPLSHCRSVRITDMLCCAQQLPLGAGESGSSPLCLSIKHFTHKAIFPALVSYLRMSFALHYLEKRWEGDVGFPTIRGRASPGCDPCKYSLERDAVEMPTHSHYLGPPDLGRGPGPCLRTGLWSADPENLVLNLQQAIP